MAVQLKHNYHHLPLTITPILCQPVLKPAPMPPKPEAPDLTFHCMCCSEYFVHPLALYQHMNSRHPNEPAQEQQLGECQEQQAEEGEDYSWIFEPVCELEEQEQQQQQQQQQSQEAASGDSDSSDDDDDSDDDDSTDDDDSSSSSSSSNSSSSSSSMPSSTSNSNTQQSQSQNQEPMDSLSNGASYVELGSAHPMRCLLAGPHPNEFHLQMADSRESTSIILLQPSMSITPLSTPVSLPHPPQQLLLPAQPPPPMSISMEPAPIKRRRGRRSKANNPMLESAMAANPAAQKCFQCSHCEASFPNAGDLSKHVRSHITNKPFQCSICQKTFTHIGSLNTHIRIHSGEKPYKCELCPKAFTQSSSLMVHMRSHAVRKPHQCVQCDKGFVNYTSLLLHQKTHTAPTETFACPECEREFKAEALLDEHMRMHTQELVYQCAICREAFRVSSELVQHMKNHMGEKPFTCSLCDRSFTQSGSLNIHMRIHTGEKPFQCKLCDKCFTQASSLSVHMKIHAGEKPFPCHICGKSYSQQAYLNKHIQSHNRAADTVQGVATAPMPMQQRHETLVCIVCGSLHADATALALHVTSQHAALLDNIKHTAMPSTPTPLDGKCSQLQQQAYMQRVQSMLQQMNQQQQQLPAMDSTGEDEEEPEEEEDPEEEDEPEESLPEADDCPVPSVSASEQETAMDSDMYYEEFADMDVGCQEEVCGDYVANEEEICTEEIV
ncbi:zinc finger protein 354B isoform X1 [Drosophila guanche]|uniref:Blast:Zinc finger protein 135 n=2 Tax=Drosophila guanche TaxID=7266 RepID=A0A3B0JH78_DROGU|nr:zinc finger protein 354B isoform X1 [Drosophila guanche]SPP81754.1 blast:Zinc finger protein 135 [Drosophila guanche]